MTAFHMGMAIRYARWFIKNKSWTKYPLINGVSSKEEALEYLDKLEKRGYTSVPCCKNVNSKGSCMGISEISKS